MLTAILSGLLAIGLQATALPSNDDFAAEMRNRPPMPGTQQTLDPSSQWLVQCLDQLEQDASRAHTLAQIRRNGSVGTDRVLANHCLGLAATELGLWNDAQVAFTAARDETPGDELRTRARFGAMAGNAALEDGQPETALALLIQAETDADNAAEGTLSASTAIDRARVLVSLGLEDPALDALRKATQLLPQSAEAWLLQATLLRRGGLLGQAQAAIERANDLAPLDPQIGLEAGVIAALEGRDDAARASWQSIIDSTPDAGEVETARAYLAQLEPAANATDEVETQP